VTTTFRYQGCLGGGLGLPCEESRSGIVDQLGYDELGQLTVRGRGGFEESFSRDQNGNPIAVERTADTGVNYRERRAFDQQGFMLGLDQESLETNGAPNTLSWTYVADSMKRLEAVRAPGDGATTNYVYDHQGRVQQMTRGDYAETLGYDTNGNLKTRAVGSAIQSFGYTGFDQLASVTDPELGSTTLLGYTDRGDLNAQTVSDSPHGFLFSRTIEPDAIGRPVADRIGNSRSSIRYEGRTITTTGPRNAVHSLSYDSGGRPLSSRVPGFFDATFTLDLAGRVTRVDQIESGAHFGAGFSYDPRSSLETVRDVGGVPQIRYENRTDGLPKAVHVAPTDLNLRTELPRSRAGESLGTISPTGITNGIALDEQRRVSGVGPTAAPRRFVYDTTGRVTNVVYPDSTEMTLGNFDARNRPQAIGLPGGGSITAGYDLQGRLQSQRASFGGYTDTETFEYDGLDRVRLTGFTGGTATNEYSFLGVRDQKRTALALDGVGTFTWSETPDELGAPRTLSYPSGQLLEHTRSNFGRLEGISIQNAEPLITSISYGSATATSAEPGPITRVTTGATLRKQIAMGARIQREDIFDHRRRLIGRRYTVNGRVQADLRYQYDRADREIAVQFAHEGGRSNFYRYDADSRLIRAELGALPNDGAATGPWSVDTNDIGGDWAPGDSARVYRFDTTGQDRIESIEDLATGEITTFSNPDSAGFIQEIGGFTRTRDALGNTTLLETETGASQLRYDARSRLRRVIRQDGTIIDYTWRSDGMLHHRSVQCSATANDCVSSETAYVYNGLLLLEEYDAGITPPQLIARYFYSDEADIPVGADFFDGNTMRRHYFMVDRMGSVIGVLDENGTLVEKTTYDPWGRPRIEARDTEPPEVSEIRTDPNGDVIVVLTEPITAVLATTATTTLDTRAPILNGLVQLQDAAGIDVAASVRIDFSYPGMSVGSVLHIIAATSLSGPLTLAIAANTLQDAWGNTLASTEIPFTHGSTYVAAPLNSTGPAIIERSAVGNSVGFQSHLFDFDADLILARARVLDPRTSLFLQRDPHGYEDSVNLYAFARHDPINNRDPSGKGIAKWLLSKLRNTEYRVGARAMTNLKFAGRKVTTRVLKAETKVNLKLLRRVEHRFPGIEVPFGEGAVVDFTKATTKAGGAVESGIVAGEVRIGKFSSDSAADIRAAWREYASTNKKTPAEIERLKKRFTWHHSVDEAEKGRLVLVDSDVHDAFRHTGGDALKRGGFLGAGIIAFLAPNTLEAAQADNTERTAVGAGRDLVENAPGIDLFAVPLFLGADWLGEQRRQAIRERDAPLDRYLEEQEAWTEEVIDVWGEEFIYGAESSGLLQGAP
jgi:RHS repeat-associated protein